MSVKSGRQRAVFILGMHRSGTSALTGLIGDNGVALGDNLLGPQKGENDKGFFEHKELVDIHISLMSELGLSWQSLLPMPERWLTEVATLSAKQRIIDTIDDGFSGDVWGFKDPRLCRLLPLWSEILNEKSIEPYYVVILRDPREVAFSLYRRNRMPYEISVLLWLIYNIEIWKNVPSGTNVMLVTYDQVLKRPDAVVKTVNRMLNTPDYESKSADIKMIDPSLKHCTDVEIEEIGNKLVGNEIYRQSKSLYEVVAAKSGMVDANDIVGVIKSYVAFMDAYFGISKALMNCFDFSMRRPGVIMQSKYVPSKGASIVIYGTGAAAKGCVRTLKGLGYRVTACVRGSNGKAPADLLSVPVVELSDIKSNSFERIVVAASYGIDDIAKRLESYGYIHEKDYVFYDQLEAGLTLPYVVGLLSGAQ